MDETQPIKPSEPTSRIDIIDKAWLETNGPIIIDDLEYEQETEFSRYPYHDDFNPNTRNLSEMHLCWQLKFMPPPPGFEKIETLEDGHLVHIYWLNRERDIICCPTAGQFIEPDKVLHPGDRLKQIEEALPGSINFLDEQRNVALFIAPISEILKAAQTNAQVIGPLLKPYSRQGGSVL